MSRRSPNSIGSLGLALVHRWEPDRLFVIVTTYIDESGTHGAPHMVMGGWVGRWGQWENFDPKWRKLLKDNNDLSYFHSKQFRHRQGEFSNWKPQQKHAFISEATDIAFKHLLFGFTILLRADEYQEFYVAGHRPKSIPLDTMYGLCFRFSLCLVPYWAQDALTGTRNIDLHFVLESGHKNAGDAVRIFNLARNDPEPPPELTSKFATLAFGDKKDFPGLQAADVNAHYGFRNERDGARHVIDLPPNATMKDARKLYRAPVFRVHLTPNELKRLKQMILDNVEQKAMRRRHRRELERV